MRHSEILAIQSRKRKCMLPTYNNRLIYILFPAPARSINFPGPFSDLRSPLAYSNSSPYTRINSHWSEYIYRLIDRSSSERGRCSFEINNNNNKNNGCKEKTLANMTNSNIHTYDICTHCGSSQSPWLFRHGQRTKTEQVKARASLASSVAEDAEDGWAECIEYINVVVWLNTLNSFNILRCVSFIRL